MLDKNRESGPVYNVDVVTFKDLVNHVKKHKNLRSFVLEVSSISEKVLSCVIQHFLKHSDYHHIFIDEMPQFHESIDAKNDFFSSLKTFCITKKSSVYDLNTNEEWIKNMEERYKAKRVHLKHNLRNTETIVNLAACFDFNEVRRIQSLKKASFIPNKKITGKKCYHYYNIHQIDEDKLARAAIRKYELLKLESVLVLTQIPIDQNIYDNLQEYFSTDCNIVYLPRTSGSMDDEKHIREVKEYLEEPEGILVTDIYSFNGAQARNIIIIVYNHEHYENIRNMIMRTMSFAIIIHNVDIKQSVPGLIRDDNLHEDIHPGNTEQLFCKNTDDEHRSNCDWPIKEEDSESSSSSADSSYPSSDIEDEDLKS